MDIEEDYFNKANLIVRYLEGTLTDDERETLETWKNADAKHERLFRKLTEQAQLFDELQGFAKPGREASLQHILERTTYAKKHPGIGYRFIRIAAAAAILIGMIGLGWWIIRKPYVLPTDQIQATHSQMDVLPGKNSAVLTLSDGRRIDLSEASAGILATERGQQILKTGEGTLIYKSGKQGQIGGGKYFHIIQTPRGGSYQFSLPDGSKVWLNAASSLRFPADFETDNRVVQLSGEAYFEVAPAKLGQKKAPFTVLSESQKVQVLGTHFNVNGYPDEGRVTTTLLEGKVKVIHEAKTENGEKEDLILNPGQQSTIPMNGSQGISVAQVDTQEYIAWKEGQFQFKDTDLPTIMRQVARWYDVEVEYEGKIPEIRFRGKVSRNAPLKQLFEILKTSGVNFKLEGRKIIIS